MSNPGLVHSFGLSQGKPHIKIMSGWVWDVFQIIKCIERPDNQSRDQNGTDGLL